MVLDLKIPAGILTNAMGIDDLAALPLSLRRGLMDKNEDSTNNTRHDYKVFHGGLLK
jgi:hypothetical protein